MKKALFTLLIFYAGLTVSFAQSPQNIITGQVINQQTGTPIFDVNVLNPQTISVGGKWHNDRIAETLPINYSPSD
jgi:hypothetical protein